MNRFNIDGHKMHYHQDRVHQWLHGERRKVMPTNPTGFTGTEIVERVKNYVGNQTAGFQTYIQDSLALAEFRFCKIHDWKFLHQVGLSLVLTANTPDQILTTTAGFSNDMDAENIELIYDETNGAVLKREELSQLRRFDAENDDGSATAHPQFWATTGQNSIRLWPPIFEAGTIKVDGKISPEPFLTMSSPPTIPYKYQESFIEYVTAMALSRENDDRARAKKQEAMALIRADIQDDLSQAGSTENPRIKSMREARFDGAGTTIEALLFPYSEY